MHENKNITYYPLFLNLQKYPCLVIGGGEVAFRKIASLLEFNAIVTNLSPEFCEEILVLKKDGKIQLINDKYSDQHLENFKIVFCATDNNEVNKQVEKDCSARGVLLNVVDIPELCDFIVPASIKRGDLTVAVSSQGRAPFYTKAVKEKLSQFLSEEIGDVLEVAGYFRKRLLDNITSHEEKEKAFSEFLKMDWEKCLKEKSKKSAYELADEILKKIINLK